MLCAVSQNPQIPYPNPSMPAILKTENLATRDDVVTRIKEEWAPLAQRTRQERKQLQETWLRYDNLLKVRHDSNAYFGRIRANLPIGRRVIENWVVKLKNDLFPDSGFWLQVRAESQESEEGVATLESLFRRFLWDYMRVRRKATPILRQLVGLGTSPIDIGWRYLAKEIPTLEKVYKDTGGNMGRAKEVLKKVVEYVGPTCRPIDLFRFYVYPTSVNDVTDLTLILEDMLLPWNTIERMGRTPIEKGHPDLGNQFENIEKAKELVARKGVDGAQDKFEAERRRLTYRGLHSQVDSPEDPNQLLVCAKGFWRASLVDDEEGNKEFPQWYQIVTAGNDDIPLQVRKVVFWDGEPSILAPKFIEVLEEFYGYGLPHTFDSLAYLTNDILNQGADALTWSLNPIAGIDPGAIADMTTIRMRPGAKWLVRRPRENISFMEPPKDSASAAMSSVNSLIALINDSANVAPFAAGSGGPRTRGRAIQTAGGMAMVNSENMVQVHDIVQGLEDLWLDPMLKKMYSRTQQCLDIPVLLNIEGARGAAMIQRSVTREDLIGEYTFRWQASTSNYNAQVRGQQMIGMLQTLGDPNLQSALQAENKRVSIAWLVESIWREGLQLPSVERLIQDIQPVRAMDVKLENELYFAGRPDQVHVSPADDDVKHLMGHDMLLEPGKLPPEIYQLALEHMQEHVSALMAKQAMQQMQAQQQAMGAGMGAVPGLGGPPPQPGGGGGAMNPGRPAMTATQGDLGRTMDRLPEMTGMGGGGPVG